ncbi:protein POLLENLESS 3-like [Helianthus annuus]|uniref:protein POLLENLESS 3-like n=1 Tax=Helianthus annuus TaxID=4232 RepID=UPI0016530D40|nr:protein POLLENLESS 3-like [Helianthus annuus]
MWINKDPPKGFTFSTHQPEKNQTYSAPSYTHRPWPPPVTEKKWTAALSNPSNQLFHIIHNVPAGDSPYVRAKDVQGGVNK